MAEPALTAWVDKVERDVAGLSPAPPRAGKRKDTEGKLLASDGGNDWAAAPTLSWLDYFQKGADPKIDAAIRLIRLANIFLVYFEERQAAYQQVIEAAQLQQQASEAEAEAEVKRLKLLRRQRNLKQRDRRALKEEIGLARKELDRIIKEGKPGWRKMSLEDVQAIESLAVDPTYPELAGAVETVQRILVDVQVLIEGLGDFESETNKWLEKAYVRLRAYSYFTQQINRPYLSSGKSGAWSRTCNVTSLAMVLRSLGITPHHFLKPYRYELVGVFCEMEARNECDVTLWEREVSHLLLPDFLQLAAIQWFWEQNRHTKQFQQLSDTKQIGAARRLAKDAITGRADIFETLASRFGLQQDRISLGEEFDYLPSIGREISQHLDKQEVKLRIILAACLSEIWTTKDESEGLAELVWDIGFRPRQHVRKLGPRLEIKFGPVSEVLADRIADMYRPSEGSHITVSNTNDLSNVMIRTTVANLIKKKSRKETDEERGKILKLYSQDKVFAIADELGLKRTVKDILASKAKEDIALKNRFKRYRNHVAWLGTPLLWIYVAESFHCHAEGERELTRARERFQTVSPPDPLMRSVQAIFSDWEEINKLLTRFNKATGQQLRQAVMEIIKPRLDRGACIVLLLKGHYVFLVEVNDNAIIVNDPAYLPNLGSRGKLTSHTWHQAEQLAFFRAFHVFFHPDYLWIHPKS